MYTFKKEERLCNKRLIDELFRNGSSFLCYPFRVVWLPAVNPQASAVQVVMAVPKKRYKRAVDRNLIRRRMREAYRLNKQQHLYQFLQQHNQELLLSITYIGKEINDYSFIEKKMLKLLNQLNQSLYAETAAAV